MISPRTNPVLTSSAALFAAVLLFLLATPSMAADACRLPVDSVFAPARSELSGYFGLASVGGNRSLMGDPVPTITVEDLQQSEGNGFTVFTFAVLLSVPSQDVVTVNYGTADGTATSPSDYTAASGTVTFEPGETLKLVVVSVTGDSTPEPDEFLLLHLFDAVNAEIEDGTAVGTIINDDGPLPTPSPTPTATPTPTPTPTPTATPTQTPTPTPSPTPIGQSTLQFSSTSYSVNESVGTAIVTVTRSGSGADAASVNYATSNGTATAGKDYVATSGTLTWAAGDTSPKTISIVITNDAQQEANETVNITLSNATGAILGSPSAAVLTILDNDGVPEITINDVTQAEGNAQNPMVFTVGLSTAASGPVTVTYSTENSTAVSGSDFVGVSNAVVTFNPGETSKQITITIIGDFVVEPDESFLLNLTSATGAIIADSQAVGTIVNDDSAGTIQFSASNYTVDEAAGTATITITRTGGTSQGVAVQFVTVNGSAVHGEDYTSVRITVVFDPGQDTRTVAVPIINDSVDEPNETVILALENPTGGGILGSPINAVLTILDDDAPPVLSINNVSLNEGNEGTTAFTFTVTLAGQSSQAVSVSYATANGTATAPGDYTAVQQSTLIFEPGETSKQVTVLVNGDFETESNETFTVNLNSPLGATIGTGQGIGTILNDDIAGAFRFTSASYTVGEGSGLVTITVQRIGGLSSGASVDYSTANGTAIAGQDYTAVSGTLTFAGGQSTLSFTIPIANDGIVEFDETFSVILSNAVGVGATLGVPNTATVFISDSATPPVDATLFDYDGDGRADLSVRRPSNNTWYLLRGTAGYTAMQWGIGGDRMAPADYDGDGQTDVAVFRPSNGTWYIHMSQSQTFQQFGWGANGDLPVPSDRNGDGVTDLVVYRPSNNTWYTRLTGSGLLSSTVFGQAGDKPVIGDFDGDGLGDIAVFRPSNNNWYIQKSSEGYFVQTWGLAGDIPAPADYDGDGETDLAVFRPSVGRFYLYQSTAGIAQVNWGQNGDIPVPADYDGDGRADVAVYRPSNSTWYIIGSGTGFLIQQFGVAGDVPTPSAFIY